LAGSEEEAKEGKEANRKVSGRGPSANEKRNRSEAESNNLRGGSSIIQATAEVVAIQEKCGSQSKETGEGGLSPPAPSRFSEGESLARIRTTIFSIKLTMKARQSPTLAWNALVKAWCGHPPLQVSLLAPGKAEIFNDPKHHDLVMEGALRLKRRSSLQQKLPAQSSSGYFRPLRLVALSGFEIDQTKAVLELAKAMIPQRFKSSKEHQNLWQRNIEFDQHKLAQQKAYMDV